MTLGYLKESGPYAVQPRATVEFCKRYLHHDCPAAVLHSGLGTISHVSTDFSRRWTGPISYLRIVTFEFGRAPLPTCMFVQEHHTNEPRQEGMTQ